MGLALNRKNYHASFFKCLNTSNFEYFYNWLVLKTTGDKSGGTEKSVPLAQGAFQILCFRHAEYKSDKSVSIPILRQSPFLYNFTPS